MSKPVGPICNLGCAYCFYLDKEKLYGSGESWRMSDPVLEAYISQYIQQQDVPEISFAWQGGEPTLLGVEFFQKVVALQQRYAQGKTITNALQTNGTLLTDSWCEFFTANKFLIGMSVDGPRELHDQYRVDKNGKPTFAAVMRGVELLKKHKTDFNTLTVVNRANVVQPLEVYRFLKEMGSSFMQFIPLVERAPSEPSISDLAEPPVPGMPAAVPVTPWSVPAAVYGDFLCTIFDHWVRRDVGTIFVQLFDVALGNWMGMGPSLCVFAPTCGKAMALEHNGDLYSCDHYVYPRYLLGNITHKPLRDLVYSPQQLKFGADKSATLPRYCRRCPVLFACHGECPKHRFATTPDGEPGLNYLCPSYRKFFQHIDAPMKQMAGFLRARQPAANIMRVLAGAPGAQVSGNPGRNDPCPCGSGQKYKKCCGAK